MLSSLVGRFARLSTTTAVQCTASTSREPLARSIAQHLQQPSRLLSSNIASSVQIFEQQQRSLHTTCLAAGFGNSLHQMYSRGPPRKQPRQKSIISGHSEMKAVVTKVLVKKPKKPNSGNRRCVQVKLADGRHSVAYIPGEGHNLQEHSMVIVIGKRKKDLIGVRLRVVRGRLDCAEVQKKAHAVRR